MSHADRLLEVLRDGKPHSHHELYRLGMIVHSRISDLRRRGHTIDRWREGDDYFYRLVRDSEARHEDGGSGTDAGPHEDVAVGDVAGASPLSPDAGTSAAAVDQLELIAAAPVARGYERDDL